MKKNNKYEKLTDSVIELLGGRDNIGSFTHCITRLRFAIKDKGLVNEEAFKDMPGVTGINWSGSQLQIIIGQNVGDVYKEICEKHNFEKAAGIEENLDEGKKKFRIQTFFEAISGCIIPLLPILIGVGFIKIFLMLATMSGLMSDESSTYTVLTFAANAGFNFLPVFVGATAARKFGANMGLGMLVGAIFMHPTFVSLVGEGASLTIFGIPVYAASYTSSIFPTLITVWVMSYIEKFIAKKSPDVLRVVLEPFLTLMIIIPLALCLLGPIGAFVGQYLAAFLMWLYGKAGFLSVALLAGCYSLIVMTGMHTALTPYRLNTLATLGYEPLICTAMIINNINQGAAALGVALKSKDKESRSTAVSCAVSAIVAGITEPAMYGVNVRHKKPLYAAIIGGLCGGAVAGLGKASCYEVFGSAGIFALPTYLSDNLSNLVWMLLGVLTGFAVTLVVTLLIYKEEKEEN